MPITKLYIDQPVVDSPQVDSILANLKLPAALVKDRHEVFESVTSSGDFIQQGKKTLFLTVNKGGFIKKCPGTRNYTCCGYKILHIGAFCVMDCSYCILQTYYHPPVLQYFVNHRKMLAELDSIFAEKKIQRIGTGEFTDSLIWESWTDLASLLVPVFSKQVHAVLELKTKTTAIKNLEHLTHNRKTIVSWSLNTNQVVQNEERGTASISARLNAAAKCESWGYPIAFHFDPMVIYDGWEEDYHRIVRQIFSNVSSKNIVWISLGSFRFMPSLKPVIQKRFPDSKIIYGEFITGLDGKMRYFKPLRINLYRKMVSWIKEIAPDVMIYFCMEDDEVWKKALGFLPSEHGGLSNMLDQSAKTHCSLDC